MRFPRLLSVLSLAITAASVPAAAYEEIPVPDGGVLTGVVRFTGRLPKRGAVATSRDRDACGERKMSETLVLGTESGVKDSVVLLEGVGRGKRGDADVVLDNRQCGFVPHVAAMMAGRRARVKNSDSLVHASHGLMGGSTVFNVALPHKGEEVDITRRLTKPGIVRVVCDVHPNMLAWLVVHRNPYVAVTDEQGAFRIDGIPPGTYRVTMWHEGFRPKGHDRDGRPLYSGPVTETRDLTLVPRATATVDFKIR